MDATREPAATITATVTIEGPAEEILAAVQRLRAGERAVSLTLEIPRRGQIMPHYYTLPPIKAGQTQRALETLDKLSQQTLVDAQTERRAEHLIRGFAGFTAA
jgi:hypothetical protein